MNTTRGFEGGESPHRGIFDELNESNEEDANLLEQQAANAGEALPSEDTIADENDELEALLSGRTREASATRTLQDIIDEEPVAIKALEGPISRKILDELLVLRRAYYQARLQAGSTKNSEVEIAYADYQAARQKLAHAVTARMESNKKSPVTGRMLQQFWLSDQGLENTFRAMEMKVKSERKFEFIGALAAALDRTPFGKALKFITMGVVAGTLASDTPKAPVEAPFRVESVESLGRMPSVPQAPPLAEAPVAPEVVIAHDEAELLTDADIAELTKQPPVVPPQTIKGEPFDNEGLWQPDSTREEGK